jgi:hypothetical protein
MRRCQLLVWWMGIIVAMTLLLAPRTMALLLRLPPAPAILGTSCAGPSAIGRSTGGPMRTAARASSRSYSCPSRHALGAPSPLPWSKQAISSRLPWLYGRMGAKNTGRLPLSMRVEDTDAVVAGDAAVQRSCWVRCVEGEPHLSVTIEIGYHFLAYFSIRLFAYLVGGILAGCY